MLAVERVVILMLENRSFDGYFGTFPGANGFYNNPQSTFANAWIPSGGWTGPSVLPYRLSTFSSQQGHTPECNHGWAPMHTFFANGAMNGWSAQNPNANSPIGASQGAGNPVSCMGFYAANDIPYHWWLAQNFALCDNYFCSHMGVTEPNRLYMIGGTIRGNAVYLNNPGAHFYAPPPNWPSYPDLLSAAGVSWRLYDLSNTSGPPDNPGTTPDVPPGNSSILNPLVYFPSWPPASQNYVTQADAFRNDAMTPNGLQKVSWIIPNYNYSEHPLQPPWDGAAIISQILEPLLTGPNWQSSVLIITYDESDGHFDHVPPPQPDPNADSDEFIDGLSLGAGFRVPTFVISPWTFGRGICSDPYDHTSILRFLEEVTLVPCPNLSNWRRQTFKSLSSLTPSFASSAPIISVPARPDAVALQTNAINRYQGAPNKQDDNTVSNWQPTLSPSNLVPTPQNWPPVAQGCQVIMTIPSYSQGQVQDQAQLDNSGDTATFPNAFIVVVDGFEPIELTTLNAIAQIGSVAAASPPTNVCATRIPAISITDANGNPIPNITSNITVTCTQIDFDPNNAANQTQSGVPRRFTFTFSLTFQNINDAQNGPFSFGSGEIEQVWVNAAFQVDVTVTSSAELDLVTSDDPQFYHNFTDDISWLSGELRVFSVQAGTALFGVPLGDPSNPTAATGSDALKFITRVITALNNNQRMGTPLPPTEFPPNSGNFVTTFDDLNQDENTNPLSLFLTPPGATPIFNFALARVHMQAQVDATVRVFFRSFRASVTTSSYDPVNMLSEASTFRSNPPPLALPGPGDSRIPLLGVGPVTDANGQTVNEYVTIPFFATVRKQIDPVNPGPMLDQQDIPNVIPIPGSPNSAPTQTFFGCWLDINRPTPLFPIQVPASPSDWDGPFTSGALPILQAFTYDLHQCLVAEISYDGINIPPGETPASSAWLAQRNLGFTQS